MPLPSLRNIIVFSASILLAACNVTGEKQIGTPQEANIISANQWAPITLDFIGPETDELAEKSPFTDIKLDVVFRQGDHIIPIRGYYAADGNAAETSASSGAIWRVHFVPETQGEWTYEARLSGGKNIALNDDPNTGANISLDNKTGSIMVGPTNESAPEFYRSGTLIADKHLFRFKGSGRYWMKGGANSPENLLGYIDFDGTYRKSEMERDGESKAGMTLHRFTPHIQDWREGDPTWQNGKGKGLIGAMNYLSDQGMNSAYMLLMNVNGDGNDTWPWIKPNDPSRFDVSKLAQWDIIFTHMQRKGILLHFVIQETENELLLDNGDTGPMRSLYFREMIARFAHHPALVWNLGEENGPVHWLPKGQSDAQRKASADFIAKHDRYDHLIQLHTHSEKPDKDNILTPILGHQSLGGLSFQVSKPEDVASEMRKWLELSAKNNRPWLITMDEIGPWHTGAKADVDDPTHDNIRRHALWGSMLAGGAGVEWYFGSKQKGNDLDTEDWRSRAQLWKQTRHALDFFNAHLPYWEMQPCADESLYCLTKPNNIIAAYFQSGELQQINLPANSGTWKLQWFDPISGGDLQQGSLLLVNAENVNNVSDNAIDNKVDLGKAPSENRDWVILLTREE